MIRILQNGLIIAFLLFVLIEAVPVEGKAIGAIRKLVDPIGDVTGLWQGRWNLFAPSVDKENNRIEAHIYFSGQDTPTEWSSPDWKEASCLEKFLGSREIEYYDRIRSKRNSVAWESLAKYIAAQFREESPDRKIEKVELISVISEIPRPNRVQSSIEQGTVDDPTGYSRTFFTYLPVRMP